MQTHTEASQEPCKTSNIKSFATIVNSFSLLAIITKFSI